MELSGQSLIGASRGNSGSKTFFAVNPTNQEPLPGKFQCATPAEVDAAARLATEAFAVFTRWSGRQRAALLNCIAELLEAEQEKIIQRLHFETALPLPRLQGELARTCFQLRFYGEAAATGLCAAARIDHGDPMRKPLPKPDVRSCNRPIGPVAVFGSSNFPLAYSVAGGDTAAAMAAGCPVIVKAHPAHPGGSEIAGTLIQRAVREIKAPSGVFLLLFDDGFEVGTRLVQHPLIKAVGFTGSWRGGRALMELAAARPEPIPVYAEMGSINPVFILPDILTQNWESLAISLHASVTLGVGQFCTNPGLVFVPAGPATDSFLQKLAGLMSGTPAGTMLTAGIEAAYRAGVEMFSSVENVRRLTPAPSPESGATACLFATDARTFLKKHELMDEVFGPSTLVVECTSQDEMLAVAERLRGQLTASIHASNAELAANVELIAMLENAAGRLIFNGFPTGVEVCHSMVHGGPYPATSDGRSTSVGTRAIERFLKPISFQNFPDEALPDELKKANPLGLCRLVDGKYTT